MVGRPSIIDAVLLLLVLAGWQAQAWAHAFLDHGEPGVGAELKAPPAKIVLYFDSELELPFSGLRVEDASGQPVCQDDVQSDPANPTWLSQPCPPLPPGTYRVVWSVIARDTHHTEGDYTFTIQ
jgi:methionine-rich copper-binding protein CopC